MDHRQDVMEGNVDISGSLGTCTQLDSRTHNDRAIVVCSTWALSSVPDETTAVCKDTGGYSGTIVSTPTNQHHTGLWDFAVDLEVIKSLLGGSDKLAGGGLLDRGGAVGVLGVDMVIGIGDIGRVHCERLLDGGGCGSV